MFDGKPYLVDMSGSMTQCRKAVLKGKVSHSTAAPSNIRKGQWEANYKKVKGRSGIMKGSMRSKYMIKVRIKGSTGK